MNDAADLIDSIDKLKTSVTRVNYRRTHVIRADYFAVIDTHEKAYWLGFLYADGYVTCRNARSWAMGLCLAAEDAYMVEHLRDTLNPSRTIALKRKRGKGNYQDQVRLNISSNRMVLDLIEKNIIPNKSLVLKFPSEEQVPNHLLGSFIRGYFDGDGSFVQPTSGKWYAKIVSSNDFALGLHKVFQKLGIKSHIYSTNSGRNSSVQICTLEGLVSLANLMYAGDGPFLKRKRKIFHDQCDLILSNCQSPKSFKPDIVCYPNGKFCLRFSFDGKRSYLGMYSTREDALRVFDSHVKDFENSFTRLEKIKLEYLYNLRIKRV